MLKNEFTIAVKTPFSPKECLWFLDRGFDDCSFRIYPDKIRRAFRNGRELMLVDIRPTENQLHLQWLTGRASSENIGFVTSFVSEWLGIEEEIGAFYEFLSRRAELAYMAQKYAGLRFIGMPDLFEALVWSIIGQQVNLNFAYKIKRRLTGHYGESIDYNGDKYYLFPLPEVLVGAKPGELRDMQLSTKKAEYIVDIAKAFTDGTLSKEILQKLPDQDSRLKKLLSIRGVGKWTANYTLMKSLREPSCIPYGDAGLLNGLMKHGLITTKADMESLTRLFNDFKGWESYLVFYLWRSLAPTIEEKD